MYWPTPCARQLHVPPPLDNAPVKDIKSNRRGNLFVTVSDLGLSVWAVRPSVCVAALTRTKASLERWGWNADVVWSYDGKQLLVLTDTSHILLYDLVSTDEPAYIHPPSATFPVGGGAGEGDSLTAIEIKPAGTAFVMGGCKSILASHNGLLLCLARPSALLRVPYPIPPHLIAPPSSHFPSTPLDGETEAQVECELWELDQSPWISKDASPTPVSLTVTRVPSLPSIHTMLCDDGRVYVVYSAQQVGLYKQNGEMAAEYQPINPITSPLPLPDHQVPPKTTVTPHHPRTPRFVGQKLYPAEQSSSVDQSESPAPTDSVAVLGLLDGSLESAPSASADAKLSSIPNEKKPQATLARATAVAVNGKMSLAAVATETGDIHMMSLPIYPQLPRLSYSMSLKSAASLRNHPGKVTSMAWTSDGYALAVGYEKAWAVWSMGGRLNGWGMDEGQDGATDFDDKDEDLFMNGVQSLFWGPGNTDLFVLATSQEAPVKQLYIIPFAKNATTSQHSPDNTRYAFLQLDDRVLVYRGADQPDMSVINPQSDVWQHIKIPNLYISSNWPLRYATISNDGKLIAVAGRRGLTHYSATSGRWKLFADEQQEAEFSVRGGLLWFHHVLVAAVESGRNCQIRLYSRDLDLSDSNILHFVNMPKSIIVMSLLDNSLLVYDADNTLYHFLILPTRDSIRLHLCGSMSFKGVVAVPWRVRAMSWMIPKAQKQIGDPVEDLIVATIIFLVDGKLVLLRPRKAGSDEVRYDVQVLADRIESYWTHLHGIGTLENSLWGYDGAGVRVWLDALTIEATRVDESQDSYEMVKESIYLRLDFYPLSILMDKGILIGVEHEASALSSLPFAVFKVQTGTHLFLPHFLRHHLTHSGVENALLFANNYKHFVYFAHALEILLHSVLEDEVDAKNEENRSRAVTPAPEETFKSKDVTSSILPVVIEFLDYFPEALEVVVACARKTEVERWQHLFDIVGKPRDLFEDCMRKGMLKTATSYLLVLHTLEELDDTADTIRLLKRALAAKEHQLCKELLRFLHSADETGEALCMAVDAVGLAVVDGDVPRHIGPTQALQTPANATEPPSQNPAAP